MKPKQINFTDLAGFQPKQLEALHAVLELQFVLYGGAAGGGKSYWLRWLAVALLMKWAAEGYRGVRVGLFCEDYPAIKERHISKIQMEFPAYLGRLDKSNSEFILAPEYGGGVLALRNLDDPSKYLSAEFAAILIDELTKNVRSTFDFLRMRLRWPGVSDTKFAAASNPGSVGHGWVKRLWIDRDFREENVTDTFNPETFGYVQALYSDNKFLPENYGDVLGALPEKLRRAYMEGDWDVFEGQYFTEFRRDDHVIEPWAADDKETWDWFNSYETICGLDYGYAAPSAVNFGKYIDGTWYIFDEIYQTHLTYEMLRDKILEKEHVRTIYADPAIWAKQNNPLSGAMKMDPLKPKKAMNDRIIGWNFLKQLMIEKTGEIPKPRLQIFSTCKNLIRTLPTLVYDETKIEDLDTDGEDHAADALRYLVQTHRHLTNGGSKPQNYVNRQKNPGLITTESDVEELFEESAPNMFRISYKK